MNATLLASLAGLAVVDSINPSAIAATLFLMTQPRFVPRALTYVAGVFATYLAFGLAGMLGLDLAWKQLDSVVGHAIIAALGAALLVYALFAPDKPSDTGPSPRIARFAGAGLAPMAVLGATITIAEISTALPYVAALSLLAEADVGAPVWAGLLVAYNLIFVTPPLLIIGTYLAVGERVRPRLERWEAKLRAGARTTLLWLMGAAGFMLASRGGALLAADLGWIGAPG